MTKPTETFWVVYDPAWDGCPVLIGVPGRRTAKMVKFDGHIHAFGVSQLSSLDIRIQDTPDAALMVWAHARKRDVDAARRVLDEALALQAAVVKVEGDPS